MCIKIERLLVSCCTVIECVATNLKPSNEIFINLYFKYRYVRYKYVLYIRLNFYKVPALQYTRIHYMYSDYYHLPLQSR